jgi:hypothetical protein
MYRYLSLLPTLLRSPLHADNFRATRQTDRSHAPEKKPKPLQLKGFGSPVKRSQTSVCTRLKASSTPGAKAIVAAREKAIVAAREKAVVAAREKAISAALKTISTVSAASPTLTAIELGVIVVRILIGNHLARMKLIRFYLFDFFFKIVQFDTLHS